MKQPAAIGSPSVPRDWRHPLWLGLLVSASVVFSLGLACAVPLAAFAAAAALSLSRRDALLLITLVWLANQLVGFTVLQYPWTASTFTWGVVLGAVAILATLAGQWIAGRLVNAPRAFTVTTTFLPRSPSTRSHYSWSRRRCSAGRKFIPRRSKAGFSRSMLRLSAVCLRSTTWPHPSRSPTDPRSGSLRPSGMRSRDRRSG